MRDESAGGLAFAQGNSVDGTKVPVSSDRGIDVGGLLRGAVDEESKHMAVAAALGYQPDYWARVLTGERGITLARLGKLPREVQVAFVEAWARALGLQIERREHHGRRHALRKALEGALALAETW